MPNRSTTSNQNKSSLADGVPENSKRAGLPQILPGLGVATGLAVIATVLGKLAPVVGAPVFAILAGIMFASIRSHSPKLQPGLSFSSKAVLQGSIVVLGTGLSFRQVLSTGAASLPVLLGTLSIALIGAWLVGRALGISKDLRTLIGVGTGICGASAIAATDAVIEAQETDVSYAIATIFTFNILAVLTFPSVGRLMSLTPHAFGLWAGTAINDMSSVVAAASIFSTGAGSYAVIVKLTRTLMIIPITLAIAIWRSKKLSGPSTRTNHFKHVRRVFPVFIAWFLAAVFLNTFGLVPNAWHSRLSSLAEFMITIALGSIGLSTRLDKIRRAGPKPLALGAILWLLVAGSSLLLQLLSGTI
ncbi:MAG: YeiH family putative sulfate export transporter [Actinomycetota bacterium]|nr:MAG: YeiH family putative sulfate export transporter [Actinomycetota bacterium]